MKAIVLLSTGISLLTLSSVCAAKDYYKWVDAHGSTHYSATPPPKEKGIRNSGKVKTYGSGGTQDKPATTQVVTPNPKTTGDAPYPKELGNVPQTVITLPQNGTQAPEPVAK